jgi:hypothetical protein
MPTKTKQRRAKSSGPPKRLAELVSRIEGDFIEEMRRQPTEHDRLFYWSYCYSDAEFKNQMIELMLQAKIPQRLIYIYDKTGFMVNDEGYKRLSNSEKKEIRLVSLQFDALSSEGTPNVYAPEDYNSFGPTEGDPLIQAIYILGNFIERNINSGAYNIDERKFVCSYLLVRAFRIVRAIFRSKRYSTSEESLVLLRSLYEIYCKLVYAVHSPSNAIYLLDSDFGLATGNYEFLRKNGKIDRHVLVHKKTGRTIPRNRSFYEYISCSRFPEDVELFDVLYDYLSSFVHSGSRHVLKTWVDRRVGFSLTNEGDEQLKVFVLILTSFTCSLIMHAILQLRGISRTSRWDMSLFCRTMRGILSEIGTPAESEISHLLPKIKARAAILPRRPVRAYK